MRIEHSASRTQPRRARTFSVSPSCTSHAQPEPNWATAASLNCALNASTEPKEEDSASEMACGGGPPPPGFMHIQKKL